MFDAHDSVFVSNLLVQKAEGCLLMGDQNALLQHTNTLSHVRILMQRPVHLSGAVQRPRWLTTEMTAVSVYTGSVSRTLCAKKLQGFSFLLLFYWLG